MKTQTALSAIFRSAVAWTGLGLAGGLFYREFTRGAEVAARSTQLSLFHTHTLTLGTIFLLLSLLLVRNINQESKLLTSFVWLWNIGLALTSAMLLTKGVLQVSGNTFAESAMLAGIAGLGHMSLTAGFIVLLLYLRPLAKISQTA